MHALDGRETLAPLAERDRHDRNVPAAHDLRGDPSYLRVGVAQDQQRRAAVADEARDLRAQSIADRHRISEVVVDDETSDLDLFLVQPRDDVVDGLCGREVIGLDDVIRVRVLRHAFGVEILDAR